MKSALLYIVVAVVLLWWLLRTRLTAGGKAGDAQAQMDEANAQRRLAQRKSNAGIFSLPDLWSAVWYDRDRDIYTPQTPLNNTDEIYDSSNYDTPLFPELGTGVGVEEGYA